MHRNRFLEKIWLWVLFLGLLFSLKTHAVTLTWSDETNGQLYRIDTDRKVLELEDSSGTWKIIGAVILQGIDERDFPPTTRVTAFTKSRDQRYLTVDCTGQVYQFDFQNRTLKRTDHTFFRGFNCNATRFVRKDTLYSFGGYGFWHTNNLMTYYKADKGEWESITSKTMGPASLHLGLNSYIPQTDAFFSTLNFRHNDAEQSGVTTFDFDVYKFSFKNQQWQQLGVVTDAVRKLLPDNLDNGAAFFASSRYFIISHYASPVTKLFLIDPIHNQFRVWEDTHRRFLRQPANTDSDSYQYYIRNDTLNYYLFNGDGLNTKGQQQKVPVSQLWNEATPVGPFYTEKSTGYEMTYLLLSALAGIGLAVFFVMRRKNKKPLASEWILPELEKLNQQERKLFDSLLTATTSGGLSAEQVNEILQIADKAIDNQRRIRAEVIQNLNLKLKYALEIDNAVERTPSSIDRRMTIYILKEEVARKYATSSNPKQAD